VVALINTLFRFSESLAAVEDFRQMWRELDASIAEKIVTETETSTAHQACIFPKFFLFSS